MKKCIFLVEMLVLLASCVNEFMDEEVLNKPVNNSITRSIPTSELRCEITTPAVSGASILSSKGKVRVHGTWNLVNRGEAENVKKIEFRAVDLKSGIDYSMFQSQFSLDGIKSYSADLEFHRPGSFGIQLVVVLSGRYGSYYRKYSPYTYVNILFPTSLDVMSQFKYKMDLCWEKTKVTTKEYGFYVYLNGNSDMTMGEIFESVPTNAQGEAFFTIERKEAMFYRWDPRVSNSFAVAQFHTHPPLTNASFGYWRIPGPSVIDMSNLPDDIPCLVYDYDRNELKEGKLRGGHKPNIPGTIYTYNGTRRPVNSKNHHL